MAQRWIRVDVVKAVHAEVYLEVDDEQVDVRPCAATEHIDRLRGGEPCRPVSLTCELARRALEAAGALHAADWDEDAPRACAAREVTAMEAAVFADGEPASA